MSWANLTLYCAVLPSYDSDKEEDDIIDADNPDNNKRIYSALGINENTNKI